MYIDNEPQWSCIAVVFHTLFLISLVSKEVVRFFSVVVRLRCDGNRKERYREMSISV